MLRGYQTSVRVVQCAHYTLECYKQLNRDASTLNHTCNVCYQHNISLKYYLFTNLRWLLCIQQVRSSPIRSLYFSCKMFTRLHQQTHMYLSIVNTTKIKNKRKKFKIINQYGRFIHMLKITLSQFNGHFYIMSRYVNFIALLWVRK